MNKQMSRDEIAEIEAYVGSFADMILRARPAKPHPGAPFAKRAEGRARRIERRQVRAAKSSWLNS